MRTPVSIGEWDEKSFDGVRGKSRSRSYIKWNEDWICICILLLVRVTISPSAGV
jgi:hypothetical protein